MALPHPTNPIWYARNKLAVAVQEMATSELPLRERIVQARRGFIAVDESDLPEEVRADFRSLLTRMTWAQDSTGEGTLSATMRHVSDEEVRRLAQLIVDVEGSITSALFRSGWS